MSAINLKIINPSGLPSLPLRDRRKLPNCAAIYFVLESEKVIYIGQATSLVLKWQNHDKLKLIKSRTRIRLAWLECTDTSRLKGLETILIKRFRPELNKAGIPKLKIETSASNLIKPRVAIKSQRDIATGKFFTKSEPNNCNLNVRVPISLKDRVMAVAGNHYANWFREAIMEKLVQETCQHNIL